MVNRNDSLFVEHLLGLPEFMAFDFFYHNCHKIIDDSNYWNLLGTLWKKCGSVINLLLWIELFRSNRKNRHKIMKNRERKRWRSLPKKVIAYRAINNKAEIETAISWTLNKKIADDIFSHKGLRQVVSKKFDKKDILAFFDRRGEEEIIVLPK